MVLVVLVLVFVVPGVVFLVSVDVVACHYDHQPSNRPRDYKNQYQGVTRTTRTTPVLVLSAPCTIISRRRVLD